MKKWNLTNSTFFFFSGSGWDVTSQSSQENIILKLIFQCRHTGYPIIWLVTSYYSQKEKIN